MKPWKIAFFNAAMPLALSIFFFSYASADPICNRDGICINDQTYAFYKGELHKGVVKTIAANNSIGFLADGEESAADLPSERVAVTRSGACLPSSPKACIDLWAHHLNDGKHNEEMSQVLGFFSFGFIIVKTKDGPISLPPKNIESFSDESCSKDHRNCIGDQVFSGIPLHLAKVEKRDPLTGALTIDGKEIKADDVASISQETCSKDAKNFKVCPGMMATSGDAKGIVLGVFPDGTLALSTEKAGVSRVKSSDWTLQAPAKEDEREILNALAGVAHLNELLTSPKWQDCSGITPGAIPHFAKIDEANFSCDAPLNQPITADNSENKKYFEDLLAKGDTADLSDFLKLWYPEHGDGLKQGSPFFACEDKPYGNFKRTDDGCQPDLLFSWGPTQKINEVFQSLPDLQTWTGVINPHSNILKDGSIFTSISAVSTFGYGEALLRIKVKRGTNYQLISYGAQKGSITVRKSDYNDFTINDPTLIESISTGTPEIYDEIVRDILHFKTGLRTSTYVANVGGLYYNPDGHPQDEAKLKMNLRELIREILSGEGKIHYANGACRNRALTFSTSLPFYIEPMAPPEVKK